MINKRTLCIKLLQQPHYFWQEHPRRLEVESFMFTIGQIIWTREQGALFPFLKNKPALM